MARRTYDPDEVVVTFTPVDGGKPIVMDHFTIPSGPADMMSAIEFDEETDECERRISTREIDRRRDDVLDTSHVADKVR